MKFTQTKLPEVIAIDPIVHQDPRGFFYENYQVKKFAEGGITLPFVQDNHSRSTKGVLRGMHFQLNHPQGKLVRVVKGEVFDVAIDIRPSSPRFKQWVGENLSDSNKRMLYVPPGFAHGFLVLSDIAEVEYKCTDLYSPPDERGIIWNDPDINIKWPVKEPILSEKDKKNSFLKDLLPSLPK